MDPIAEIDRLLYLARASLVASLLVIVGFFGTLIYLTIKMPKNREVVRSYSRSIRWKIFTSFGKDWEALVEPAHREELRLRRRYGRYMLIALMVYLTLNVGIKALRAHWLARVGDLTAELSVCKERRH